MVLTRSEFVSSLQNEVRILLHLASKIDRSKLDYRPTPKQRSTLELLQYLTEQLSAVDGIRLIGTASKKAGVQSFLLGDIHPHDLGTVLDHQGVAIRTGHHCAMPVMDFFGVPGTARASLAFYNDRQDIDQLVAGLALAKRMLT